MQAIYPQLIQGGEGGGVTLTPYFTLFPVGLWQSNLPGTMLDYCSFQK